ncbi:hypothetical protein [Mucilaginibacter dorajii]|uniref:Uncharacterized protein n=1 Tax=Mucilaginibacter dorajii TaxID=692994 RepID=A0ABP7RAU1_9SPHI|nr:hypothetical protein [Mucilaginibacter dorajii]MCS3736672.1 hypothetical protein [Mucilaginibacter dorajii]
MKHYILVAFVLMFNGLVFGQSNADEFTKEQVIKLLGFDGKTQTIKVLANYNYDILTIASLLDTLHIRNCTVLEKTTVLNKKLLEIIYSVRAGSGLHEQCMLIVGCKNNKLYQSFHIISLFHEDFIDFSKKRPTPSSPDIISQYAVKLKISTTEYPNYKMNINVHSENKSKEHPRENYNRVKDVVLNFDPVENIFYGTRTEVSKSFNVFDPKKQKERRLYIKGNFPTIALDNYQYYYIKGEWYLKNVYSDLAMLSY